jgi:hypothetical protein
LEESLSLFVNLDSAHSLVVRVPRALGQQMTEFLAAQASQIALEDFLDILRFAGFFFFLRLVFLKLAAKCLFACLSAAPPHLTAPLTLVQLAAPVEVLFLYVLVVAIATRFNATVKLALA